MRTALSRLEREALHRRLAKECPPHPDDRIFCQPGDYGTPDRIVCGRCFQTLATRQHKKPTA